MSNDTKFWVLRGVVAGLLLVDSWVFFKALQTPEYRTLWFGLFSLCALAGLPLYVWYRKAKEDRWHDTTRKTQEQLEVEALAAYGKQRLVEKDAKQAQQQAKRKSN